MEAVHYDSDSNDSVISVTSRQKTVQQLLVSVPEYMQKVQCDLNEWTAPFKCAVNSCTNVFVSYQERDNLPYKFHNFPGGSLSQLWKKLCNLPEDFDVSNVKVCSDHFTLDDYIRNYKEEFVNPNFKRKLKLTALPSLNLGGNSVEVELPLPTPPKFEEVKRLVDENERLSHLFKLLHDKQTEYNATTKLYAGKIASKTRDLARLTRILKKFRFKSDCIKKEKNLISKVFSEAQIRLLMGRRKVVWSDDDLAKAFTMRHMGGKECYLYLKKTLNIPLPALSCVQKWAATFKSEN